MILILSRTQSVKVGFHLQSFYNRKMDNMTQEERNADMRKRMLDVSDVRIGPLPNDSPWLKPVRLHYVQDGRQKLWDTTRSHDSVCIIIFNKSRQKLVFVKQFRPASYYIHLPQKFGQIELTKYPPTLGLSLELCAGIVDKDKPLAEIARDEVREECGYEVSCEDLTKIVTYRFISDAVALQSLFYVEVTDEMHIHTGGGSDSEGELIEVVEMSIQEAKNYMNSEEVHSPPSFLYGLMWFLTNKT